MYIKSQSKYASSTVQPRLNERASMLPRPSLCSRIRLPCSILFQSQFLGTCIPLCHRTRRCPLACQPPEGSLCMEVSLRPCIPRESPCLPMNSLSTEALAPLGNQRGGEVHSLENLDTLNLFPVLSLQSILSTEAPCPTWFIQKEKAARYVGQPSMEVEFLAVCVYTD